MPRTSLPPSRGCGAAGQAGQVRRNLHRPGRPGQSGFSLIEVLVAFVLLSLTLAVVMQLFSGGLQNAGAASMYARAMILAESRLALLGADQPLTPGTLQGEEEPFRWRLDITPFADPGLPDDAQVGTTDLLEVTMTVGWQQGRREPALTVNTLRLVNRP